MANHLITITGINEDDDDLILSDDGETIASPGDTITWIIGGNSGVASITAITEVEGEDVFNPDPVPVNSSSWEGLVKPVPTAKTETYNISYLKIGDATIYISDPRIRVNP